jgi:hypothetical protein
MVPETLGLANRETANGKRETVAYFRGSRSAGNRESAIVSETSGLANCEQQRETRNPNFAQPAINREFRV